MDFQFKTSLPTGDILLIAEAKIEELKKEINEMILLIQEKQGDYERYCKALQFFKDASNLQKLPMDSEIYSKEWKWPTKTIFILKKIKRPLTAKEVIKSIEIYEGKIPEEKKTGIFAALTNLAKVDKVARVKSGGEFVYSYHYQNSNDDNTLLRELEKIENNILKTNT